MLTDQQVEQFVKDGFIRLDHAFPRELADQGRKILWRDTGCQPDAPTTWTRPVVWLGAYHDTPFVKAANTPQLREAYDQLVGPGGWLPLDGLGTFPVRFPSAEDTGDTGWHVDASFPAPNSDADDYLSWRINVKSKGRALLMLFLFSDVGEADGPTRIRIGSHTQVARLLRDAGEEGVAVGTFDLTLTATCPETVATGDAGTVYLCHPFLVHAAQVNRGSRPRFMAQPPLIPATQNNSFPGVFPVEHAIRMALGG